MKLQNKGQVTIFAIIAIILLLLFSLIFYLMIPDDPNIREISGDIETVDEEIEIYVRDCLTRVTDEALDIVRLQGGYIEFPRGVVTKMIDSNITVVNNRVIEQPGKIKVPYYIVNDQLSLPSLDLTTEQIESYVDKQLLECIDGFSPFIEENYEVDFEPPVSNVNIDELVIIQANFPIEAKRDDFRYTQDNFFIEIPINFKEMYRKATRLTIQEYLDGYLERHGKKLISLYAHQGGNKELYSLPPFALTIAGFDCEGVEWKMDEVENNLKTIYDQYYSELKIGRLNNTRVVSNDKMVQGVYDGFIVDVLAEDLKTHLDISYESKWGLSEFDVAPKTGDKLEPQEAEFFGIPMLPGFCSHRYAFKYSYRHPVLFEMSNDVNDEYKRSSSKGKFTYNFLMESHLCGNRVKDCGEENPNLEVMNKLFEELNLTSSICETLSPAEITLEVKDENNNPVDEAYVRYFCGDYLNDCHIGETDSNGLLKTNLPYCMNGVALFTKKEHYDSSKIISVTNDIGFKYDISMLKEKYLNYSVKLIKMDDYIEAFYKTNGFTKMSCEGKAPEDYFGEMLRDLPGQLDSVIGGFQEKNKFYNPSFTYSKLGKLPSTLNIPPGDYVFSSTYMGNVEIDSVTHAGREVSMNKDGEGPYKGMFPLGSFQLDVPINVEDLINGNTIEIFILVNHFSDEELNVSSFTKEYINEEGDISYKIKVEENSLLIEDCQNQEREMEIRIPKEFLKNNLQPQIKRII
ncbi:hypothetical protein KY321_00375 [Candidatus Woesearchaeota archaeon]|nr:hypothetical protein [Candidatus Woesearchaeota archaeon]